MTPSPDDHHDVEPPQTRIHQETDADEAARAHQDSEWTLDQITRRQPRSEAGTEPLSLTGLASPPPSTGGGPARGVAGKIEPNQVLYGKYQVIKKLGSGAMGDVWQVHHTVLKNLHALKLIVANIATNDVVLRRFQREFEVMASLNHAHAVRIYDACIDEAGGFIDMEYVAGQTLHDLLAAARRRPDLDPSQPLMPLPWICRILDQLTDVLQEAHEKGIVHRDLKPSNLMLLDGRKPGKEYLKVLDFGIAKIRDDPDNAANNAAMTQGFIGTPSYSSPEQALNREDIDGRADLYSVGVMLYEFITGRLPFKGVHYQVVHQHASVPPPSFAEANPQLRPLPELEHAILRVLAKDRDGRPQTARDLFDEVQQAAEAILGPDAFRVSTPSSESIRIPAPDRHRVEVLTEHDGGTGPPPIHGGPDTLSITTPDSGHAKSRAKSPSASTFAGTIAPPEPGTEAGPTRSRRAFLIGLGASAAVAGPLGWWFIKNFRPIPPIDKIKPILPEGYAAVIGYERDGASPERVIRKSDQVEFELLSEGIYLPSGYKPDGDGRVDGWPRYIVHTADPTRARFVRIEAGKAWMMGAWDAPDAARNDAPAHQVVLRSGFYIQETEVTNGQYDAFLKAMRRPPPSDWEQALVAKQDAGGPASALKHPAVGLTHKQAVEFARYYNAALPTEAQWEFAARSQGLQNHYVWGNEAPVDRKLANINYQGGPDTSPVGSYPTDVTKQGLLDMTGNVKEMCRDIWKPYKRPAYVVQDPCEDVPEPTYTDFVVRGGDFHATADVCTTTYRDDKRSEKEANETVGFRMVVECPDARGTAGRKAGAVAAANP